MRSQSPVHFTPRQREVLDLLARGYTNAQIASALGVSLDGAKWHVREILEELQVDSREEAAEYWRRQNALPARLRRLGRGIVPGGLAMPLALAVGIALALAVGVVIAVFALRGGDDTPASPPPPATPTTPSATATATPTASPTPTTLGPDGAVIEEFRTGAPVDVLETHALYWSWAGIEGPRQNLFRAHRTRDGEVAIEDLFARLPERSSVAGTVFDVNRGRIAVLLCRVEYCGGYGSPDPASEAFVTLSTDYGVTWSPPARVPVGWFPAVFDGEGLIAIQYRDTTSGQDFSYERYPSGEAYPVPAGGYPTMLADGRVVFSFDEPGRPLVDAAGTVLYTPPSLPGDAVQSSPLQADRELAWTLWWSEDGMFAGRRDNGLFVKVFHQPRANGGLYLWAYFGHGLVLSRLDTDAPFALRPVLVDLDSGAIHAIEHLGEPRGYFAPFGAVTGRFAAAIPGAGDCLNVRASPALAGAVAECVPDGVLLRLTGGEAEGEGGPWLAVATLAGNEGWASAAFLR